MSGGRNYRLVRDEDGVKVREVYYDGAGWPKGYTERWVWPNGFRDALHWLRGIFCWPMSVHDFAITTGVYCDCGLFTVFRPNPQFLDSEGRTHSRFRCDRPKRKT